MKFKWPHWSEIAMLIAGPIVIRVLVRDDVEYLLFCLLYVVGLSTGKYILSEMDDE